MPDEPSVSPSSPALPQSRPKRGLDWSFLVVASLSVGSALYIWRRDGSAVALSVFEEDALLFLEIVPKVVAGTLIGALVRLMVPREVIVRWLGASSGWRGLLIATLAGVLIPAGPFTVFPLAAAFLAAGADAGACVAFITAWLMLGLNRAVIWELPFFGTGFVGMRMAISAWVPLAAGYAARHLVRTTVFRPTDGAGDAS